MRPERRRQRALLMVFAAFATAAAWLLASFCARRHSVARWGTAATRLRYCYSAPCFNYIKVGQYTFACLHTLRWRQLTDHGGTVYSDASRIHLRHVRVRVHSHVRIRFRRFRARLRACPRVRACTCVMVIHSQEPPSFSDRMVIRLTRRPNPSASGPPGKRWSSDSNSAPPPAFFLMGTRWLTIVSGCVILNTATW